MSTTFTDLVFYLLVFLGIGSFFLFIHLLMGKAIRPSKPESEKLTIYECGEPTVGSAWIQFDLRYYVVALLFVIFDVEVAFFFPWAVVFGTASDLSRADVTGKDKAALSAVLTNSLPSVDGTKTGPETIDPATAASWAWFSFLDILVFFGVLMMGFAYVWRRGDIDWVRSTAAEKIPGGVEELPARVELAATK